MRRSGAAEAEVDRSDRRRRKLIAPLRPSWITRPRSSVGQSDRLLSGGSPVRVRPWAPAPCGCSSAGQSARLLIEASGVRIPPPALLGPVLLAVAVRADEVALLGFSSLAVEGLVARPDLEALGCGISVMEVEGAEALVVAAPLAGSPSLGHQGGLHPTLVPTDVLGHAGCAPSPLVSAPMVLDISVLRACCVDYCHVRCRGWRGFDSLHPHHLPSPATVVERTKTTGCNPVPVRVRRFESGRWLHFLISTLLRWRNRQTRQVEGLVSFSEVRVQLPAAAPTTRCALRLSPPTT